MTIIDLANNDDASILPPNLYPLSSPQMSLPLQYIFPNSVGGGYMRVGCCIKGAWSVKGVADRGGCDKPQNNNG